MYSRRFLSLDAMYCQAVLYITRMVSRRVPFSRKTMWGKSILALVSGMEYMNFLMSQRCKSGALVQCTVTAPAQRQCCAPCRWRQRYKVTSVPASNDQQAQLLTSCKMLASTLTAHVACCADLNVFLALRHDACHKPE